MTFFTLQCVHICIICASLTVPLAISPLPVQVLLPLLVTPAFTNEFLFYYLMSPDFDAYANDTDNAKGIAYPAINDNKLYRALIPVPPESEQKRIVEKIKEALPYVATYGVVYSETESLNNTFPDRLKKSILQEAVQGNLSHKILPTNQLPSFWNASVLRKSS